MGQTTQKYKRSMSGSVGAGMKSLFGGSGRRFFVLEHKVSSKHHKAGEEQRIIVDQVEIGRDSRCAVRLEGQRENDKMFEIVSRRHAAIQRDGDNWKLIHLSNTNSTILNGTRMTTVGQEWYLQNGDEIQIAENGPKLGFKIPQGDRGLVKSIGLTARMDLFRKQALRPYKTAIASLAFMLLVVACVGGWIIYDQKETIVNLNNNLVAQDEKFTRELAETREKQRQDSLEYVRKAVEDSIRYHKEIEEHKKKTNMAIQAAIQRIGQMNRNITGLSAMIEEQHINNDVYFIFTRKVVFIHNGTETEIEGCGWCGTGFLLNDGRFVTARHCVEGWWYQDFTQNTPFAQAARNTATYEGCRMKGYFVAVSSMSNNQFEFTSDDFVMDHSKDVRAQIGTDESGNPIYWNCTFPVNQNCDPKMFATDWAYTTKTNGARGNLVADYELSQNLLPAQRLAVLGFPKNLGVNDGNAMIEPIFSEVTTSRRGLAANGCIMHSRGTDHGNSGGPIFSVKDGKLVVVGIVSRGDNRTNEHNWAVPVCNLR